MSRRATIVIVVAILAVAALVLAGCGGPSLASAQKAQCLADEQLIQTYMKLFHEDSGMYPPLQDVIGKLHVKPPPGGMFVFNATTGVVSCTVNGHPYP